jgi:hypothetical protein
MTKSPRRGENRLATPAHAATSRQAISPTLPAEMRHHVCGEHLHVPLYQIVRHDAERQHAYQNVEPRALPYAVQSDTPAACEPPRYYHVARVGKACVCAPPTGAARRTRFLAPIDRSPGIALALWHTASLGQAFHVSLCFGPHPLPTYPQAI